MPSINNKLTSSWLFQNVEKSRKIYFFFKDLPVEMIFKEQYNLCADILKLI